MRKMLFLAIAGILSVVQLDGFAAVATRGNARGSNVKATEEQPAATQPTAARAATRGAVKTTNTTQPTAARSATKQVQQNTGTVAARAGAKQKVINTGTKIEGATENTVVPQECQDAFYGCMDAFCMLDNASGGRCQCSDRITELDMVLDEILKLDEQTYIMATEGVERIQMGEAEEQVLARAKAAGDKAVDANKEKEANEKKVRGLDLSAWNNNIFSEDSDLFDLLNDSDGTLAGKTGDALYKESIKICAAQIPAKCKTHNSMLQLVYAQKIKSDCAAYENSLKAQKSQSQQKLQTAQKALRDAALEEYKNQNKYATTGECAIAFAQCMQTTAECGDDYTGCVTLAAVENVRTNTSEKIAKQTTIKGVVKGANITLAASTMEQLLSKKLICEKITKQCVNSNKNDAVWDVFLRNAALALKSAESIAEQNLRSNCIPTIAKCFSDACKSNFGDGDSYDMCLSNPKTYISLCKVQLEPCLEATGGTLENPEGSTLWNGVKAMLTSMKVDACTKEVKTCLTDRCDDDYSGCVGLSTQSIIALCPKEKLTACMDEKFTTGTDYTNTIEAYIDKIAQGLIIQIDKDLLTVCQNAANEAMIKVCGSTESCDVVNDANLGTETLNLADGEITGKVKWGSVSINSDNQIGTTDDTKDDTTNTMVNSLNTVVNRVMASIKSDLKVEYCMKGRSVNGMDNTNTKVATKVPRFESLTDNIENIIAMQVLNTAVNNYNEKLADLEVERARREAEISDSNKSAVCIAYEQEGDFAKHGAHKDTKVVTTTYDEATKVCTVTTTDYTCDKYDSYCYNGCGCTQWKQLGSSTKKVQL